MLGPPPRGDSETARILEAQEKQQRERDSTDRDLQEQLTDR